MVMNVGGINLTPVPMNNHVFHKRKMDEQYKKVVRQMIKINQIVFAVGKIEKTINQERLNYWKSQGAQLSESVKRLLAAK